MKDSDVKEVARMQSLINSYECFITSLSFMTRGKVVDYPLFTDTPLDKVMNRLWHWVKARKDIVVEKDKESE